jgi:cobalt-zinc-cadmium efflux system outer membrane protein
MRRVLRARRRAPGPNWPAKIKIAQAQRQYLHGNRKLTLEILDLMSRLEKIAQVRYAGGLAAQQDVIRAQVEQTNMRSELVALDAEARQVNARLNALLARPRGRTPGRAGPCTPLARPGAARFRRAGGARAQSQSAPVR